MKKVNLFLAHFGLKTHTSREYSLQWIWIPTPYKTELTLEAYFHTSFRNSVNMA
ncbi:hypothetical protein KO493_15515 [Tamlana agarivorans]|uniref:Uncharacterized protein n=1 Tax=Pseudotamlana agarivorans TaxID=481183 RepID=A0ACC5UCN4_9FLAO|nr:hypothetical protein [Tamlana agarivorans]MBU2952108.1 hypothetical protein [Tamlana agarivorans]